MNEEIRTTVLLDQLDEIDRREAEVREARLTLGQGIWSLGATGVGLLILDRAGANLLVVVPILMLLTLGLVPLLRWLKLREFVRERARLNTLYKEIDRAKTQLRAESQPGDGQLDESVSESDVS